MFEACKVATENPGGGVGLGIWGCSSSWFWLASIIYCLWQMNSRLLKWQYGIVSTVYSPWQRIAQISFLQVLFLIRQMEHSSTQSVTPTTCCRPLNHFVSLYIFAVCFLNFYSVFFGITVCVPKCEKPVLWNMSRTLSTGHSGQILFDQSGQCNISNSALFGMFREQPKCHY